MVDPQHPNRSKYQARPLTRIEWLAALLILSVLAALALPMYLNRTTDSDRVRCRDNMVAIAKAERLYQLESPSHSYARDLATLGKKVPVKLACPASGKYTIAIHGDAFTVHCSIAAHDSGRPGEPSGFTPGLNAE